MRANCFKLLMLAAVAWLSVVGHAQLPSMPTAAVPDRPGPHTSDAPEVFTIPKAPGSTDAVLTQARTLANTGHLAQAEAQMHAWLAGNDTSAQGHLLLGAILLRENKPAPSLAEYTKASHLGPTTPQELQYVALDYVLLKDFADADKWMTRVTQWTPQDPEAWYRLGRIRYSQNRAVDAEICFKKALALSPALVKAENNLGLVYEALNRRQDAIAAYQTAIAWQARAAAPSEQPLLNLGLLFLRQNQVEDAAPLLEQAQKIAPLNAAVCVALAQAYDEQHRLSAAQTELEQAVSLDPESAADHFLLGRIYRKAGLAAKAETEFQRAAQINGTHSTQ